MGIWVAAKNVHRLFMLRLLMNPGLIMWLPALLALLFLQVHVCVSMLCLRRCLYCLHCLHNACVSIPIGMISLHSRRCWMVAACLVDSPLSSERGLECIEPKLALCILCPVLGTNTACLSMRGQFPPSTRFVYAAQVVSIMMHSCLGACSASIQVFFAKSLMGTCISMICWHVLAFPYSIDAE